MAPRNQRIKRAKASDAAQSAAAETPTGGRGLDVLPLELTSDASRRMDGSKDGSFDPVASLKADARCGENGSITEARGLDPYPDPDPVDQRENNGEEVGAIELGDYHWMNRKDRILEHFPKAVTVLSHFGRRSVGVWSSPIPHVRVYCAASEPEVAVTLRNLPCVEKLGYLTPSQRGWAVLKHSNAAAQNPGGRPLVLAHLRKLGLVWFQGSVESLKELCILAPRGFPNLGALELVFGSMKFNNWNWEHVRRALCRLVRGMDGKLKLVVARVAPGDDVEEYKREMEKLKKDLTDAGVRCVVLEEIRVTAYHFESETYC
ncbi:hypothetical protein M427DRAFT_68210 [Gonapodya prolifera JEL478]|uniref:Uncharacterized protein n=1 Tax=Gonapodya prolifera (strain JEL478) TaxID=1344416 RepID=A0A139ALR2_GONPJ|nr:hypothetical protein M427DRAFT_68210 [Gonapodya prolifera JEL478]|eukprot:KXS17689.1 hypothetical protein M427DRAFT_68210 [Gonapodya prolifera JEL478]